MRVIISLIAACFAAVWAPATLAATFNQIPTDVYTSALLTVAESGVQVADTDGNGAGDTVVFIGSRGFSGSTETAPVIRTVDSGGLQTAIELRPVNGGRFTAAEFIGGELVVAEYNGSTTAFKSVDLSGPVAQLNPFAALGPRTAEVLAINSDGSFFERAANGDTFYVDSGGGATFLGNNLAVASNDGWAATRSTSGSVLYEITPGGLVERGNTSDLILTAGDGLFGGVSGGFSGFFGDALLTDCRGVACVAYIFSGAYATNTAYAFGDDIFFASTDGFSNAEIFRVSSAFDFTAGDPYTDGDRVFDSLRSLVGVVSDPSGDFSAGCGQPAGSGLFTCQVNGDLPQLGGKGGGGNPSPVFLDEPRDYLIAAIVALVWFKVHPTSLMFALRMVLLPIWGLFVLGSRIHLAARRASPSLGAAHA